MQCGPMVVVKLSHGNKMGLRLDHVSSSLPDCACIGEQRTIRQLIFNQTEISMSSSRTHLSSTGRISPSIKKMDQNLRLKFARLKGEKFETREQRQEYRRASCKYR